MKTIINTLIVVSLCVMGLNVKAGNPRIKYDSSSCLLLEGKILNAAEGEEKGCIIEIFESGGETADTILLTGNKKSFRYVLKKNSFYGIRVTKKGFVPRLISVNTAITSESDRVHKFSFETALPDESELEYLNHDALDFPVAIIYYDKQDDSFCHNQQYTTSIKREMRTISKPDMASASPRISGTKH